METFLETKMRMRYRHFVNKTTARKAEMETKLSLKLLVNKKTKKVLFAEASKDFVDFLLSLMCMPMGSVIKLLRINHEMVGCIGNIYQSVEKLNDACLQEKSCRDLVLSPQMASLPLGPKPPLLLKNQVATSETQTELYRCSCCDGSVITNVRGTLCPDCGSGMTSEVRFIVPNSASSGGTGGGEGGYVKGVVTYMVKDDLVVTPMSTISSITLLNSFQVQDLASLEEKTIEVGMEEGLSLLKASMQSTTALTDVFLPTALPDVFLPK